MQLHAIVCCNPRDTGELCGGEAKVNKMERGRDMKYILIINCKGILKCVRKAIANVCWRSEVVIIDCKSVLRNQKCVSKYISADELRQFYPWLRDVYLLTETNSALKADTGLAATSLTFAAPHLRSRVISYSYSLPTSHSYFCYNSEGKKTTSNAKTFYCRI